MRWLKFASGCSKLSRQLSCNLTTELSRRPPAAFRTGPRTHTCAHGAATTITGPLQRVVRRHVLPILGVIAERACVSATCFPTEPRDARRRPLGRAYRDAPLPSVIGGSLERSSRLSQHIPRDQMPHSTLRGHLLLRIRYPNVSEQGASRSRHMASRDAPGRELEARQTPRTPRCA